MPYHLQMYKKEVYTIIYNNLGEGRNGAVSVQSDLDLSKYKYKYSARQFSAMAIY